MRFLPCGTTMRTRTAGSRRAMPSGSACAARRGLMAVFAAALVCSAQGCFTGGGIPPGSIISPGGLPTSLIGRVVNAQAPQSQPPPQAQLAFVITPLGEAPQPITIPTQADGSFSLAGLPTASTDLAPGTASVTLTVTPADTSLAPEQVNFNLTASQTTSLVVSLAPAALVSTASQIQLAPQLQTTLHQQVTVMAQVIGPNGQAIGVPTLVYNGTGGELGPGGVFESTTAGQGTLTASWYSLGAKTASVTVSSTPINVKGGTAQAPGGSGSGSG